MITKEQLKAILKDAKMEDIEKYLPYLNKYFQEYEFTTEGEAQFIAQVGWESGNLKYAEEIASGSAYEGRKDLGNIHPGDGKKFKGRGLIQLTGRSNYERFDKYLHEKHFLKENESLMDTPEIVATNPELAVLSAFWFWEQINGKKYSEVV